MALFKKKEKTAPDLSNPGDPSGAPPTAPAPAEVAPVAPPRPRPKTDSYTWLLLIALCFLIVSLVYLILHVEKLKSEGHKPLVRTTQPTSAVVRLM